MGQEVFFKVKKKRYLLFEIDDSFKNGSTINIPKAIEKRKKTLGL